MSLPRHLVIALTYGVIAIAVALTLPYSLPGVGKSTSIVIGALILIFGTVLHEAWTRLELERELRAEIGRLSTDREQVMVELSQARAEMRAIQDQLKRPSPLPDVEDDSDGGAEGLVMRLTGRRADPDSEPDPSPSQAPPRASVGSLSEAELGMLVEDAIRRDRIEMALQPIVSLPQRKTRFYEALCRIRTDDGGLIAASEFIGSAERLGLVTAIDNVLLFRCVQLVRDAIRRHRLVGFFANVSIDTLRDVEFMDQFVDFIAGSPELSSRLMFEVGASDFISAGDTLWSPMERLAELGFRFSIDKIGAVGMLDVEQLERRFVRFVKVDASALLLETQHPESAIDLAAIKGRMDDGAIDLIVDRIETEPLLVELLDLPIDFGQGLLFGEPRTS